MGFKAGINFYAYVNNNPVNYNDPMGLVRWGDAVSSGLGMLSSGAGVFVGGTMTLGGGAMLAVPEPTLLTKVGGVSAITFGTGLVGKSSADFTLNAQNFYSALVDKPPSVPSSALGLAADIAFPGNQDAQLLAVAGNLTIDLASGRVPAGMIATNVDSALSGYKLAGFTELNNFNQATKAVGNLPITVAAPGVAASTRAVDWLQGFATAQAGFSNAETIFNNISGTSAGGGFVLYSSKPNTNQLNAVYSK